MLCMVLSLLQRQIAVISRFLLVFPYRMSSKEYSHCDIGLHVKVLILQSAGKLVCVRSPVAYSVSVRQFIGIKLNFGLCKEFCCL